jgi:hypothetical protein
MFISTTEYIQTRVYTPIVSTSEVCYLKISLKHIATPSVDYTSADSFLLNRVE